MIAVWYDPDCDQIWITDEERSYARRSLVAFIDSATGKVGIRLKAGATADIVMTSYVNLTDRAGFGFLSAAEAKTYLDGEFAKERSVSATFVQAVPASVWRIQHGLGFNPSVMLEDTAGDPFSGDTRHPDVNTITITFGFPVSGTAYLS